MYGERLGSIFLIYISQIIAFTPNSQNYQTQLQTRKLPKQLFYNSCTNGLNKGVER